MYHFVSGFINVTNRPQLMYHCNYLGMHHLACQSTSCLHLILLFLYFDNWLTFNFEASKYDYYT